MLNRNRILIYTTLALVVAAVLYGIASYNTPYGCVSSNGAVSLPEPPQGSGIDPHTLTEPCAYVYIVGIVGGSTLLILQIPVTRSSSESPN